MSALTELATAAEVLVATGHDPFARSSLRRSLVRGWVGHGAVAWLGADPDTREAFLSTHGAPSQVAALLADLLPELPPRQRVTLPRGTAPLLPAWVGLDGTDWDFRWLADAGPVQPGEDAVQDLDGAPGVAELLAASSPRHSAAPGDVAVRRWVGVPGDGALLACAADTSGSTRVGHLSSIAVLPSQRGRGLGRAVTAALTRRLLDEGCEIVTLGMYADNDTARRLYDALGFRDEHRFTSGRLDVRSRW